MEERMNELMAQGHSVCWTVLNGKKVWILDGVPQEDREIIEVVKDKKTGRYKKVRKNGKQ